MRISDNDQLHRQLRRHIRERIFRGDYADGEKLPPERALAESLGISRVTVRRALAQLAAEGIVSRQQGSGNRVSLSLAGHSGTMDLIAVLAHAQNAFFASFIDCFQRTAEASDTLVLFKQTPPGERLEDSLFKLLQKDIRNAVIWLEDQRVDRESIRRLRGLGMNMVFFDAAGPSPYADGVLLDNDDAVTSLYRALAARCGGPLDYVGWDDDAIVSAREREDVFRRLAPAGAAVRRIAWSERARLDEAAARLAAEIGSSPTRPQAVLCGDGEIGVAMRRALLAAGLAGLAVASPDDYPQSRALSITVYRQDFARMAQQTYQCLTRQNQPGWGAATLRVKGELIEAD